MEGGKTCPGPVWQCPPPGRGTLEVGGGTGPLADGLLCNQWWGTFWGRGGVSGGGGLLTDL